MTDVLFLITAFLLTFSSMPSFVGMIPERLYRANYRGEQIPVGLGLSFVLVSLFLILLGSLLGFSERGLLYGFALAVFGLLGMIDDTLGDRQDRGFAGHFRQLLAGKLTTGGLKALYGGASALIIAGLFTTNVLLIPIDALLIAFSANFFNLLDVRPGRCGKAFLLIAAGLGVSGVLSLPLMVLVGSLVAYLKWDLRGEVMMGDVGANSLGALLGLEMLGLPLGIRMGILFLLLYFHLYAEGHSLSQVIEGNSVLGLLDRWGRN